MASHEEDSEDAIWDPYPRKLVDVVESEVLPIVVKVQEGVYTGNEGSTFSNGDLIKIDSYITVDKVRARKVGGSALNQAQCESFTVPLDYHGKVELVQDSPVVKVVNDLKQHVTKRVRVLRDASFCYQGKEQRLNKGDIIKVVEFKGHVMSCTRGQATLLVPSSVNGQFQVLPDFTQAEYSVRDVVTTFNLPQVVHFLPAQQQVVSETIVAGVSNVNVFTGDAVLECPLREKIAVGHFKGSGEDSSRFARRSVIILPLDDPIVAELEVLCHHYSDDSDYQFFQMTHFSQSSGELVLDPNALYMDFSRPGVRFIDYKDFANEEKPPPRPPRSAVSRTETAESGRDSPDYLEPIDYGFASQGPPREQAPSRPPRHFRRSDPPPESKPHQGTQHGAYSFTLADLGRPDLPQQTAGAPAHGRVQTVAVSIGKKIKKLFHSRSPSTSSAQEGPASPTGPPSPNQPPESGGSEEDSDYDQIEETSQPSPKRPQAVVRPTTHGTQPSSTATTRPKPVAVIPTSPIEKSSPRISNPRVKEDDFQKMGVTNVTRLLEECSMSGLAKTVQEHKLDGTILSGLPREVFSKPPFNLSEFDILRFDRIRNGWRPME